MNGAIHFTAFDYIIVAIMVFSCVFAFVRGLVREILSLVAWIGAGIVTICYFPGALVDMQQHFKSPAVAAGIAGIGIFLLALIGFGLFNMIIVKSFKSSDSGMLDNMLGLLFGAARGALMVSLGFFLLTAAMPEREYPDWLTQAVTRPYLAKGAAMLATVAPDALRDIATLEQKAEGRPPENTPPPVPAASDTSNPVNARGDENTGYTRSSTQQLDRLIQSTGSQ
jgi:membrane protein required for colicin V production